MSSETAATSEPVEARYMGEDYSHRLKALGFHPGCPVYEVSPDFELDLVQRALFESNYLTPVILPFVIEEYRESIKDEWPLPMVVESVRAVYLPHAVGTKESPIGCWPGPEWFVKGFLYKSPFDPYLEVFPMNAYIQTDGTNFDIAFLQLVRNPSAAQPEMQLMWGHGAPGQPLGEQ